MTPDTPNYTLANLTQSATPPRRKRTALLVALIAAGAVVIGGGGGILVGSALNKKADPTPAAAVAAPADQQTALTPTTPAAAAPSATPAAVHRAGETITWANGLRATAYSFNAPVAKSAERPATDGYVWGAIDIQVCVPHDGEISSTSWYLKYADNTTAEPSNEIYNQFPHPEYPFSRTVTSGTCTRGWLTFPVPPNVKPVKIVYSNSADDTPAEWAL